MAEGENSFAAVAEANAIFYAEESAKQATPLAEGLALRSLFEDTATCTTCESKLGGRWAACLRTWAELEKMDDSELGVQILQVVEELDAPHLKAEGIQERLQGGVDAACFGLATLISNLAARAQKKSKQATGGES